MTSSVSTHPTPQIAILGSGPAALMTASVLARAKVKVHIFEKRPSPSYKLLIAGRSGLNITNSLAPDLFFKQYRTHQEHFRDILQKFSPADWIHFVEELGIKTFTGTSRRVFIEGLKAGKLLRLWLNQLKQQGVQFHYQHELTDWISHPDKVSIEFNHQTTRQFDAAVFALGGPSYDLVSTPAWLKIFERKGIILQPFQAANVGVEIDLPQSFFDEADGLSLKNIHLTSNQTDCRGELTITRYGFEGTPVYNLREETEFTLDLKPDLTHEQILAKLSSLRENLAPLRKLQKALDLSKAMQCLLYHGCTSDQKNNIDTLVQFLKKFPISIKAYRPLEEAISCRGGVSFEAVTDGLELKGQANAFVAGEMLDWDAPTGGFLIQACVSQAVATAEYILKNLQSKLDSQA